MSDKEKVIQVTRLAIPFGLFVVVAWWGVQNFFENQNYRIEKNLLSPIRTELILLNKKVDDLGRETTIGRFGKSHYNVLRSELREQGIIVSEYDVLRRDAIDMSRPYQRK